MHMKSVKSLLVLSGLALVPVFVSGCASVANGSRQDVSLYSKPNGAEVVVYNNHGEKIYQGKTPCVVQLERTPPESGRANYIVFMKKNGCEPVQLPLRSQLNRAGLASAWLGGAGMIVDSDVGGAWTLRPDGQFPGLLLESPDMLRPDGLCLALPEQTASAATAKTVSATR
jgi:hypothetical protein